MKEISDLKSHMTPRILTDEPTTTIIIGAGVIGLWTAYELTRANRALRKPRELIVIDALSAQFEATSSTNTGILGYAEFNSDLSPLGRYSYGLWKEQGQDSGFRKRCGFIESSNLNVEQGVGAGLRLLPTWIQKPVEWNVWREPPNAETAIINPAALGSWLYEQCQILGVHFCMETEVVSATLSHTRHIQSLNILDKHGNPRPITCDKLIIAAGPWSSELFHKLFPDSTVDLQPTTDAGDWLICRNPVMSLDPLDDTCAVYLDNIVGHKLEFAGRNDGTIWICGERNSEAIMPPIGETAQPDQEMIEKLTIYAQHFIAKDSDMMESLEVLNSGRAFRPARKNALPLITAVPARKLSGEAWKSSSLCAIESVYICSGHGSYGVNLGPGSARLLGQIIRGEKPDVDLSKMTIN